MVGLVEKTKGLFDAIPDEGACIVAITNDMAKWMRLRLPQYRGADLASRCRIVGINRMSSVNKIVGEHRAVMLHPTFIEKVSPDVRAEVGRLAHGCNAQHADQR